MTTSDQHLDDASTTAILGSQATHSLASSVLIATFGGAGLLLTHNPVQRLMFFGCLLSAVLALQWSTRLMSAVWRQDNPAAIGWEKLLTRIWQAQLFCLIAAGLSFAISGASPPSLQSDTPGLLKEPTTHQESKKHLRPMA